MFVRVIFPKESHDVRGMKESLELGIGREVGKEGDTESIWKHNYQWWFNMVVYSVEFSNLSMYQKIKNKIGIIIFCEKFNLNIICIILYTIMMSNFQNLN